MANEAVLILGKKKHRRTLDKVGGVSTVIGEDTTFEGNFSGTENIVVYGRVKGDCNLQGTVVVEEGAHWKGTLSAENVIIAGRVQGEVIATGKLELAHTAKIIGELRGPVIAVAEGAVIEGNMHMTEKSELMRYVEKRNKEKGFIPIKS